MRSVLGRWQLNGRAFLNDPDVFILRDSKNQLNPCQQNSILTINSLLGSLLFTSDNVGDYQNEQLSEFQDISNLLHYNIDNVTVIKPDVYKIQFTKKGNKHIALCNLTSKSIILPLEKSNIDLEAYETILLHSP